MFARLTAKRGKLEYFIIVMNMPLIKLLIMTYLIEMDIMNKNYKRF